MLKMKTIVAAAALMAAPMMALADVSFGGHADLRISENSENVAITGVAGAEDSFTLGQALITATMAPSEGFGGVVQIGAGETVAGNTGDFSGAEVTQAYFQYTSGGMTVTGGKFFTLAGYEVFSSAANGNISRSLLFAAQPFSLTGVRASFALSDSFTLIGGLVNSSGNLSQDNNTQKTVELGLALTPAKGVSLAVTAYTGTEDAAPTAGLKTNVIDVVGSWAISDAFTLGLNFDHIKTDTSPAADTTTTGLALYGSLGLSNTLKLNLRAETLSIDTGAPAKQKPTEITATLACAMAKNFDLLGEIRMDDNDALFAGSTEDQATTVSVMGVYKF